MIDVESDGPIPGDYSMLSFGAVLVNNDLNKIFYGKLKPISDNWQQSALNVNGLTREQVMDFDNPKDVMISFSKWIKETSKGRPQFVSDNNGFDWQFINWYFHHFVGHNPFGYSSINLGSLYKGMVKNCHKNFKHLRKTEHDHNPVNDAIGNAEALIHMKYNMNLRISL